jgi:uncharacterized protein (TIGR02996 family)
MSEEAQFLRALQESPGDDTARLVYADWLEERGDPRSEYLRLYCRVLQDARRLRVLRLGIAPDWLRQVHRDSFFKLDCGRSVCLDAFYCDRTYGGLLEGRPDRQLNDEILERAQTRMRQLWGVRKTHLVPPVINESDPQHPVLPPVCLTAWLVCFQPIKEPNAGSELVVVWFRGAFEGEPMEQVIADGIQALPWDELAADFAGW